MTTKTTTDRPGYLMQVRTAPDGSTAKQYTLCTGDVHADNIIRARFRQYDPFQR